MFSGVICVLCHIGCLFLGRMIVVYLIRLDDGRWFAGYSGTNRFIWREDMGLIWQSEEECLEELYKLAKNHLVTMVRAYSSDIVANVAVDQVPCQNDSAKMADSQE